ncbi:hypothetical protein E4U55_001981 [Claviceps digitariae]|nr:hypothetical protein E4U55_001981 [Claviceps digitariae]
MARCGASTLEVTSTSSTEDCELTQDAAVVDCVVQQVVVDLESHRDTSARTYLSASRPRELRSQVPHRLMLRLNGIGCGPYADRSRISAAQRAHKSAAMPHTSETCPDVR